ncbi:ferredoxin family protein [Gammaproteobacteria bacterium]|nr:ferredoxin family protein [Gammaproteobacteria bacterium]
MTYVVTEACIRCKYTDCVEVCPVDCFHATPLMLVINPDECIDCNLCVSHCPVDAIYSDDDLPKDQLDFLTINADLSKKWPILNEAQDPPQDADHWKDIKSKRQFLNPA